MARCTTLHRPNLSRALISPTDIPHARACLRDITPACPRANCCRRRGLSLLIPRVWQPPPTPIPARPSSQHGTSAPSYPASTTFRKYTVIAPQANTGVYLRSRHHTSAKFVPTGNNIFTRSPVGRQPTRRSRDAAHPRSANVDFVCRPPVRQDPVRPTTPLGPGPAGPSPSTPDPARPPPQSPDPDGPITSKAGHVGFLTTGSEVSGKTSGIDGKNGRSGIAP